MSPGAQHGRPSTTHIWNARLILGARERNSMIFIASNGGSAPIATTMANDCESAATDDGADGQCVGAGCGGERRGL